MNGKPSLALATLQADAAKSALDGGFLFIFAGPVPASADAALDMGADHTQVVKISVDDDGVTGLTFEAAVNGLLVKTAAEDWSGTTAFDGVDAGDTTLVPSFYRFCEAGDTGRGAATTQARIQGTVGGPTSGANLVLGAASLANSVLQPVNSFGFDFANG